MSILAWIVVGLVTGWLVGLVMRAGSYGLVIDIAAGVVGALVGGFLAAQLFGGDYLSGIRLQTLLVAFLGALSLMSVLRTLGARRARA